MNSVYALTVVNGKPRRYLVIEGKSDLSKAKPRDFIGWIYQFNLVDGDARVVVKVSSILSDNAFKGRENQMHDETIKFTFRKIREEPDATEFTFNPEDFESPPKNPPLTGRDLRNQVLKFIYEVNDELTGQGVSIFDLMHHFPNGRKELWNALSYFERKGYLELLPTDTEVRYQTASRRMSSPPYRINPSRLDDIEAELQKAERKLTKPIAESGGLKGKKFDVALSFAGEDREFVREVKRFLDQEPGIRVFYDEDFEVELWGEDMAVEFARIYGEDSDRFVPFVSKHYVEKAYPNHEFRVALSKLVTEKATGYILPMMLDDTRLEGLPRTIKHIDISQKTPEQCAQMIIAKIKGSRFNIPSPDPSDKEPGGSQGRLRHILNKFESKWRTERNGAKRLTKAVVLLTELADSLHNFLDNERSRIGQVAVESIESNLSEIGKLEVKERTYREIGGSNDGYFDEGQEVINELKQVELYPPRA